MQLICKHLLIVLLAALASCGEFNTQQHYEADNTVAETCSTVISWNITSPETVQATLYEPFVLAFSLILSDKEMGVAQFDVAWAATGGPLPPGLQLDSRDGLITGFPTQPGAYTVSVQATQLSCQGGTSASFELIISKGCESHSDCPVSPDSPVTSNWCEEPGICIGALPEELCPTGYGSTVQWSESWTETAVSPSTWTIKSHERLTREERLLPQQGSYTHRLKLISVSDSAASVDILYRLMQEWPVPYAEGDEIIVERISGPGLSSGVLLLSVDHSDPLLVYDGPLETDVPAFSCDHNLCDLTVNRLHLDCPSADDAHLCGPRSHDLLLLQGVSQPVAAGTEQIRKVLHDDISYLFSVGTAYSHSFSTFNYDECVGIAPDWASFILFPAESSPIARLQSDYEAKVISQAGDNPAFYAYGSDSFSLSDHPIVQYKWELEQQPYPGLVSLETLPAAGPEPPDWLRKLHYPAVGNYTLRLHVVDDRKIRSSTAALLQLDVRSSSNTDVRIELVWRTEDDSLVHNEELELLLMYPTYAKLLGTIPWPDEAWDFGKNSAGSKWICSDENPNPSNWLALETISDGRSPPVTPGDALCSTAPGIMSLHPGSGASTARPEAITVFKLNRKQKNNQYHIAVQSKTTNNQPVHATLRVYIQGNPMYETSHRVIAPGQLWHAGHIDVEFMKFTPVKEVK